MYKDEGPESPHGNQKRAAERNSQEHTFPHNPSPNLKETPWLLPLSFFYSSTSSSRTGVQA